MKIKRMTLKNFRSHKHTVIDLERVNFIRGMNRVGKSSIGMGVEMALSGRCSVTDEGGKGFEQLIRQGEQAATVVLEFGDITITLILDRTTGRTLKVDRGEGCPLLIGRQAQEWIAQNIGSPDVINASMNAWRFMELSEADQASLLARVLLPEKLELDTEVSAWLTGNRLSIIERSTLFQTIEATFKSIAAARTEVNRKIRDLKMIDEPLPVGSNREAIKAEIRALQEQQTAITGEVLRMENHEQIEKRNREQQASVAVESEQVTNKLSSIAIQLLPPKTRKELEAVAANRQRCTEIEHTLCDERLELARIKETIFRLTTHDDAGLCPTCKAPLTEESRQKMFAPFMTRENAINRSIRGLEKELKGLGDPAAAATVISVDDDLYKQQKEVQAALTRLESQRGKAVDTSIEPIHTTVQLKEKSDQLKNEIVAKLDVLVKIVELEQQHADYQRQLQERKRAEQRAAELERLLEYFGLGPKGIKAKLIAERIDIFTDHINTFLGWWHYALRFTIEPYALHITEDEASTTLRPTQLSASERYRVGVAFATAIAEWTGLRMLIADGADILDKSDKWKLAEAIFASDIEQAIVTSTGIAGTFEATDTCFYTLTKTAGVTATELDPIINTTKTAVA